MKVVIDENLPPALARALNALFAGEHEIIHIRDRFGPNVADAKWIGELSHEGRWIVISGDRRITKVRAEQQAFSNSRLVGFFMASALKQSKTTTQMQRILVLWEGMEKIASSIAGGAMFELPIRGDIRQLKK